MGVIVAQFVHEGLGNSEHANLNKQQQPADPRRVTKGNNGMSNSHSVI